MANNNVEIKVGVNVDGAPSLGALSTSLERAAQSANNLGDEGADVAAALAKTGAASQNAAANTKQLAAGMDSAAEQISRAKGELLALVGVGAGLQGIKDLSEVADSFKNLEAKIKLVTGEGKAFDDAFESVFEIAKRTNSAVEETGVLFTKLAEAGKGLGVSQAEALKLTETINQAIQLSGASAGASGAAIQQLVQGLQSGVLRGDEFNSVMEQSPRLAKALADGLGVGTGELRNMAEQGRLTSETVIKSLQGQSDAVQAEFGKLPATVGRAMTNLTTEFTRYIGEADKAGGYSAKLAGIIDSLAGNLGTVATVMIKVGQSVAAMKLLSMAQDWLTAGAAIKSTALATEQHTVSTAKNTIAKTQNTASVLANTEAQVANAVSTKAAAAAADTSVKSTGMLSSALSMIKPLLVLDIVLNYKQYGTAIGEFAAKVMGAKDRTQELADAEKRATAQAGEAAAARKKQSVALEDARDKTFELSKESKNLIAKFDEMRGKGDSAADAIKNIGKDFDLSNVAGIKNAGAVLDTLKEKGKITASEFRDAWSNALKGEDLAAFEVAARAAFAGSAREAERMAQVLDVSMREAIRRTGLDFDVISGGMGKASTSAINDTQTIINSLDRLREAGVNVGQALTASLVKGIKEAQTDKALAEVRQQIEQVRSTLGQKVADGLLQQAEQKAKDLKTALENITPSIQSAKEAMRMLGVTSDESLKQTASTAREAYQAMKDSGTSSARELQAGFRVYAEAAIAANNGVASGVLISEGAVRGLRIEVDEAGKSIITNMSAGARATDSLTGSVNASTQAFNAQAAAAQAAQAAAANKSLQEQYDRNKPAPVKSILTPNNMQAVDNSGQFIMRDKLRAGTLTADDIPFMETVVKNIRTNEKIFSQFAGSRSLEGMKDDAEWSTVAAQLKDKADDLKRQKALADAKQTLGITSKDETKKKEDAARLLLNYKYSLSAAEQEQLKKIPKFASGGYHKGGVRLVGENGPELEVTGPSHIIDADNTKELLRKNLEKQSAAKAGINYYQDNIAWNVKDLTASQERLQPLLNAKGAGSAAGMQKINEEMAVESKINKHRGVLLSSLNNTKWQLTLLQKEQKELIASAPVKKMKQVSRGDAQGNKYVEWVEDVPDEKQVSATTPASTPAPMTTVPLPQSAKVAENSNSSGGKAYTVHINLNGKTTTVNTSTDDDAQRLIDVLKSAKLAAGG